MLKDTLCSVKPTGVTPYHREHEYICYLEFQNYKKQNIFTSLLILNLAYHDNGFFFFKQKTSYDILTCDWSSDVCSSDLEAVR